MAYLGKENTMRALYESNRLYNNRLTWQQMYAGTDIAAQQAESAVKYNFAKDISEAYDASLAQKSQIYGGDYRRGVESEAIQDINLALKEAYDKSYSSYKENLQSIDYSKQSAQSQITDALAKEAEYANLYEQAHIDYVKDLYNKYTSGELTQDVYDSQGRLVSKGDVPLNLFTDTEFSRFTKQGVAKYNPDTDKYEFKNTDGDVKYLSADRLTPEKIKVLEEDGYFQQYEENQLLRDDEIRNMMYDEYGNLTSKGLDTYDLIENYMSQHGYFSFNDYLKQQDELNKTNLAQWATSSNAYAQGTNATTFKELVGLKANDISYDFSERLGGMTKQEVSDVVNNLNENPDVASVTKLYELSKKLGLDVSAIDTAGGVSAYIKEYYDNLEQHNLAQTAYAEKVNNIKDNIANEQIVIDTYNLALKGNFFEVIRDMGYSSEQEAFEDFGVTNRTDFLHLVAAEYAPKADTAKYKKAQFERDLESVQKQNYMIDTQNDYEKMIKNLVKALTSK